MLLMLQFVLAFVAGLVLSGASHGDDGSLVLIVVSTICTGALILLAEPHIAAMPHAALHQNRLAVQWMPGIVNRYVLSVVGGM